MTRGGLELGMRVGIDLVELAEFEAVMTRRTSMLERVFTADELRYCRAKHAPMQHLAARFAAKEAAFKAIGTGWAEGVAWHDAEIASAPSGAPQLIARGELARRARAHAFQVSLSHSGTYAAAMVVVVPRPRRYRWSVP